MMSEWGGEGGSRRGSAILYSSCIPHRYLSRTMDMDVCRISRKKGFLHEEMQKCLQPKAEVLAEIRNLTLRLGFVPKRLKPLYFPSLRNELNKIHFL